MVSIWYELDERRVQKGSELRARSCGEIEYEYAWVMCGLLGSFFDDKIFN